MNKNAGADALRRSVLRLLPAAICVAGGVQAAPLLDPLRRPAARVAQASGSVLLALAACGTRLVAAGERGVVLVSSDQGASWRQASVPVSTTLTALQFADTRHGWAVGHGGVILHTSDGGENWHKQSDGIALAQAALAHARALGDEAQRTRLVREAGQLVADGPDKPLLDVLALDARRAIVIGAYGLVFATGDGGKQWTPWMDRLDNPRGLHLNSVAVRGSEIVLAGEQGLLLRSQDGGRTFARVASPYGGSWFAVKALPDGGWLLAGLMGRIYRFDGRSFEEQRGLVPVTIGHLALARDGSVCALTQAGQVQRSADGGRTWRLLPIPGGAPLTAMLDLDGRRALATSLRGVRHFDL